MAPKSIKIIQNPSTVPSSVPSNYLQASAYQLGQISGRVQRTQPRDFTINNYADDTKTALNWNPAGTIRRTSTTPIAQETRLHGS